MNYNTEQYFSEVPQLHSPRSIFDRSFTHKTTMNVNELVPIFIDEALPGDSFKLNFQVFGRLLNPLVVPSFDELYFETIWCKAPMRLLWTNSFKFFGEKENPSDSTDYVIPTINSGDTGFAVNSIFDHFGLVPGVPNYDVNSLPLRMYNRFYNEWLRDQNLIESVPLPMGDSDDASNYTLLKSAKMHDLFTSALPTTQLGDAVSFGLGGSVNAPVFGNGNAIYLETGSGRTDAGRPHEYTLSSGYYPDASFNNNLRLHGFTPDAHAGELIGKQSGATANGVAQGLYNNNDTYAVGLSQSQSSMFANVDLSSVTGINVNDLRFMIKLQQYRERLLLGGHRYREIVSQFFGVDQLDNRAYITEFLGMTRTMIDINTVIQTSSTDSTSPQGNLTAYGVLGSFESGFSTSFVEHSYIMGLARIRHNPIYQQGLNKLWTRSTQLDFYNPMFNGLGEQPIKNKEIVVQGNNVLNSSGEPVDDDAFGFNEYGYEYRYYPSMITGQLRSGITQSLDAYHFAQYFGTYDSSTDTYTRVLPRLNQSFIEENIPIDRALSLNTSENVPQFVMDFRFDYTCARVMPVRNVPAGLTGGI